MRNLILDALEYLRNSDELENLEFMATKTLIYIWLSISVSISSSSAQNYKDLLPYKMTPFAPQSNISV